MGACQGRDTIDGNHFRRAFARRAHECGKDRQAWCDLHLRGARRVSAPSRRDEVSLAQYEVLGSCEAQETESRRDD